MEGVENVDILNIGTQGIVGVGACTRTFTAQSRRVGCPPIMLTGYVRGIRSSCQ